MDFGLLSVLPILVCFILIFISKNPYISIGSGVLVGVVIILFKNGDFILFDAVLSVLRNTSTLKTTSFFMFVGALTYSMNKSGGVDGLIAYLDKKKFNTKSKVLAQLFTMMIGILLFVDGSSSIAVTAVVGKPLFKSSGIPTEKLALVTNSTAAPIAWIIPFGGAGALTAALLSSVDGIDSPFSVVVSAIPYQFYTIGLIVFLFLSIVLKFELGGIRKLKNNIADTSTNIDHSKKARNMIIPILSLLLFIFTYLFVTGNGNIMKGNSSDAIFYAGLFSIFISFVLYKSQNLASTKEILTWFYKGIKSMVMIALLLLLAYVFSYVLDSVGTANYILQVFEYIPITLLPMMAFIIASLISFTTGTSGGTVSILIAFIIPIAISYDYNVALTVGAIISGAVFGDQNSIISDSVIMTSSVTGVSAIDHVRTQLPYTIVVFLVSLILFTII